MDQGYVLRRLIRRAVRYGMQLGMPEAASPARLPRSVIEQYKDVYPELKRNSALMLEQLDTGGRPASSKTLKQGTKEFEKRRRQLGDRTAASTA